MAKSVSFIPTDENRKKLEKLQNDTGQSRTDILNGFISSGFVVGIAETRKIAQSFCTVANALDSGTMSLELRKEVDELCQLLSSLMEKISILRN